MSSKRILVIMIAVLVALTASLIFAADQPVQAKKTAAPKAKKAETAKAAEKAPRLTIVEPVKDYGTIAKGEKLDWSFLVKNTGDSDLQIIAAKPGCGCTVADFDKVIKPGETGKVTAHVDTAAFAGPIAKTVTLETNDPTTPTSQLTIHAVVKPYVEAFPAGFVRFNLLQGDADTQSVMLYSEEDEPFQVTKVEVPIDPTTNEPVKWVKTSFEKVADADKAPNVGRPGQDQYKVNITVGGADARVGALEAVEADDVDPLVLAIGANSARGGRTLADDLDHVAFRERKLVHQLVGQASKAAAAVCGGEARDLHLA